MSSSIPVALSLSIKLAPVSANHRFLMLADNDTRLLIGGQTQSMRPDDFCFIPAGALSVLLDQSRLVCLELLTPDRGHHLASFLNSTFRYRSQKTIAAGPRTALPYSRLIGLIMERDKDQLATELFTEIETRLSDQTLTVHNISLYKRIYLRELLDDALEACLLNGDLSVPALAKMLTLSKDALQLRCQQLCGLNPGAILSAWQYAHAVTLLLLQNDPVVKVAEQAGFTSDHLMVLVKQKTGLTCIELRKRCGRMK